MRGRPFTPGTDARRNTDGRPPKAKGVGEVVAGVVSPDDIQRITATMRIMALAGDPAAAQAVALLVTVGNYGIA